MYYYTSQLSPIKPTIAIHEETPANSQETHLNVIWWIGFISHNWVFIRNFLLHFFWICKLWRLSNMLTNILMYWYVALGRWFGIQNSCLNSFNSTQSLIRNEARISYLLFYSWDKICMNFGDFIKIKSWISLNFNVL